MGSTSRSTLLKLRPSNGFFLYFVFLYISHRDFSISTLFDLLWQVLMDDLVYFGFIDGASWYTRNLTSTAWVLYYPNGHLMVSRSVCIGPA